MAPWKTCVALALVLGACSVALGQSRFLRGDNDGVGGIVITDGVRVFSFLFLGTPDTLACPDAADTDDSGVLDITDGIYLLNFLFLGGPSPPAPYPLCDEDPTVDALGCETHDACLATTTYRALLHSRLRMAIDPGLLAFISPEDREQLDEDGVILLEDEGVLESQQVEFPGRWLEVGGRRHMTDEEGFVALENLPEGLTELRDVPLFWYLADEEPYAVLPSLRLAPLEGVPEPTVLELEYQIPEDMDGHGEEAGGGAGDACDLRGCTPLDMPTGCCLDYNGIGDGRDLSRQDTKCAVEVLGRCVQTCQDKAILAFFGSTCFEWTFATNGKKTRACLNEGAIQGNGPACVANHKWRYCQFMDEKDFFVGVNGEVAFGGQYNFVVRNRTPENSTEITLEPQLGTLTLAADQMPFSGLVRQGDSYRLDHFNDQTQRHGDIVAVTYNAPADDGGGPRDVRVVARSGGLTKSITITLRPAYPETIGFRFQAQSPGATRIEFTDGSFQIIDWNLSVDFNLEGRFDSERDGLLRYGLTRKTGVVRFQGTIDDHPFPGTINRLEFDHNREVDLQSENGWLDVEPTAGDLRGFFFTVETVNGRSFYPQHVRYTFNDVEEVVGVLMTIDFPADIFPYEHEFAFGQRF